MSKLQKSKRIIKFFIFIGISLSIISLSGCDYTGGLIYGTITYDVSKIEDQGVSAYYVILDTDTDVTNGYTQRVIIDTTTDVSSVSYSLNTSDLDGGPYYLLGGFDFGNMNPDTPNVWEGKAWYGGTNTAPPENANIYKSNGEYNITLTGLN
jgi:hypothetical protein